MLLINNPCEHKPCLKSLSCSLPLFTMLIILWYVTAQGNNSYICMSDYFH